MTVVLTLALLSAHHVLMAQSDSSETRLIGLPILFSTPETGFAFGGLGVISYTADLSDTLTPSSQIQFGAVYTTQDQLLVYSPFEWYTKKRRYTFRGELGFFIYTYRFFGIGEETEVEGEPYEATFPRIRIDGLRRVSEHWYVGMRAEFDDFDITRIQEGGLLDQGVIGAQGGRISGLGGIVEYDSRDNVYSTYRGSYLNIRGIGYDGMIGSDFDFQRLLFDARTFRRWNKTVVGVQLNYDATTEGVPFSQMAVIGGQRIMRGYFSGRFRDRQVWATQTEVRRQIRGRLGAVAFVGVAETFESSADLVDLRWAGGLGVRFGILPKRRINIRIDYALGEAEDSGVYFTIGEAF